MSSSHLLDSNVEIFIQYHKGNKIFRNYKHPKLSKYLHSSLYSNKLFPISKAKIRYKDPQIKYSAILYDLFYESIWQLTRTTDVT